ncbi:helix-turn-helix transcriptional regulator [Bacillus sp. AG4(2022)]|uniref:helix-turn-helix domain-containing protein n=1 Tax=Bacillus sp. AG4(2022) TaxID=2962594 RepID=UPI002881391C|nr:helix-turn-helix transcriptional regulator [Bacillus sp. AG4(2022)]MDT0160367.1 helix-turn-helix transcriptional regulator [Bacillus sp. AG4(2022)]
MEVLAKRLKWLREKERYSQKDIAEKIGMSTGGYQKIEQSQRDPKLDVLVILCDFFNVSADFLLGRSNIVKEVENLEEKISLYSTVLTEQKLEMTDIFNLVNVVREKVLNTAKEKGFEHPDTIKVSNNLDEILSNVDEIQSRKDSLEREIADTVYDYIVTIDSMPFGNFQDDYVIEPYKPFTTEIQNSLGESAVALFGKDIGFLGYYGTFRTKEAAEKESERILAKLNSN